MKRKHFDAIDGLKGIAILTVVCTHIPLGVWFQFIPQFLRPFANLILSGGNVGVNIFFITTGFLMGFLYPVLPSSIAFYGRRYGRLFPAFLVMTTSFMFIEMIKEIRKTPPFINILIVIGCALIMRYLWKRFHGKNLIRAMLIFQAIVALWYVFFLLKVPASIFYLKWNSWIRIFITWIVNSTLTLPFGTYIDQLDGIYWALCAEVFFYLIYPFIIPIIQYINREMSLFGKALLFLTFLPFCYGLFMISERILNFIAVQPHLIIYFLAGVFIGINVDAIKKKLSRFQNLFAHPVWIIFMLAIIFSSVAIDAYLIKYLQRWLSIFMVLPMSVLLLTIIAAKDESKSLLKNRILQFLGKYSYAIFLTHSIVIHVILKYIHSENSFNGLAIVVLSFLGVICLSLILHALTESPYFHSRTKLAVNTDDKTAKMFSSQTVKIRVLTATLCILILAYSSFRAPLAFFTFVFAHTGSRQTITLTDKPFRQSFIAKENGLGMIITSLRKDHISGKEGGFVPFELLMRLTDDHDKTISQSKFLAYQISENRYHPFGFPIVENAKGNKYTVEYQLSKMGYSEEIKLITDEANMLSVYFVDKKKLSRDPELLFKWAFNKLNEPLTNPTFQQTFLFIFPFLSAMLIYVYFFGSVRPYESKIKSPG